MDAIDAEKEFPEEYIQKKIKDEVAYSNLKLSPIGDYAAYTYNRSGKYRVYLKNMATNKRKKNIRRRISPG